MRFLMPWFLPFAAGAAYSGTRLTQQQRRSEGRNLSETLFLVNLTWFPLLYWLLVQFTAPDPRHP